MATKEEIKAGTYSIINNHTRGKLTPSERRKLRDALLEYEDSQGVVIKVGELPSYGEDWSPDRDYGAVESLL